MAGSSTDFHVTSINKNAVLSGGTFFPNGAPSTVNAQLVATTLAGNDVTLTTFVNTPNNNEPGDIIVDSGNPISWSQAHSLTFEAAGSIGINAAVTGLGGALALDAHGGTITQTAAIGAAALTGTSAADVTLTDASNAIAALGRFVVASGDFTLTDNTPTLTIDGSVSATHDITITNVQAGGTIAHAPDSEKQHLVIAGSSGTFTLTYNGQTTAALAFNATEAQVHQALFALSTISGAGLGLSTDGSGGVFDIIVIGAPGGGLGPLIIAAGSGGATATVTPIGPSPINGHDVTLTADQIALDSHTTIAATDEITLAPETAGRAVTLGDSAAATGLIIDNTELGTLTAPMLTIGNATAGTINLGAATVSSATLNLVSGAGVSSLGLGPFTALTVGGGTGTVNVAAAGAVDLFDFVNFGAIGGTTTSGGFVALASFSHVGALAANAIGTAGGEIILGNAQGDLNVNGALSSAGGNILASSTNGSGSVLTINATIDAGAGALGLVGTGGGITQTSGHLAGVNLIAETLLSGPGAISLTSVSNAVSGHIDLNALPGGGDISFTDLSGYTIGGLAQLSFTVVPVVLTPDPGIRTSATATVTLTMGGNVIEASGAGDIVSTGTLNLLRLPGANPNVTLSNASNVIGDLHSVDLGTGFLTLVDSVALTIDGAVSASSVTLQTAASFTLAVSGSIATNAGATLSVATNATLDGVISGNGGLAILAGGIVTLTATDSYHGITTVAGGTLLVDGSIAASVETDVQNGATLGGHGTVGAVHVLSGGTLSPGNSPGVLTTGSVTLDAGAHFIEQIGGTASGSFDQLQVHGSVNLGGATLDLSLVNGFAPSLGQSFTLIDNDGSDGVTGTFAGLAEGTQINLGGINFTLSYHGGDGNDVTLSSGSVPGDFNADKISDVLWQGAGASLAEWLMNAGAIAANLGVGSDSGLHFLDTADFNADGHSDALWRDDSGNVTLWTLDSAQILAKQSVATIDASWQNQGVADFNGDGHADALWRKDGQVALWTMNGSQITGNQSVTTGLSSDWRIQGLGDFNGDHNSDVLLRSASTGQIVLWSMNGSQITANQSVTNLGLDWHVLGTGDFTADGKSDILLRNDNGQVALLTMNGNQIAANQNVASIDASWHAQGISDYTGDGHADVLWRNDSGQVALWEMNGNHIVSDHTVIYANGQAAPIDQTWSVLHHAFDLV